MSKITINNRYNAKREAKRRRDYVNIYDAIEFKPFDQNDLKEAIRVNKPIQSMFTMVVADYDMTKLSNMKKLDVIENNPDAEIESVKE